jgi:hypothetical protein
VRWNPKQHWEHDHAISLYLRSIIRWSYVNDCEYIACIHWSAIEIQMDTSQCFKIKTKLVKGNKFVGTVISSFQYKFVNTVGHWWKNVRRLHPFKSLQLYRVSQEERSTFWEIIVSAILRKKFIWTCVLFRTVSEIELFECTVAKSLIRKRYYVLFLIFIVQGTNLLVCNTFRKFHRQHQCTLQLVWEHGMLLVWKFLYAGNSIHYAIEQFFPCIHFYSIHFTLHPSP